MAGKKDRKPLVFGDDQLRRKEEPVQIGDRSFILRQGMGGDIIAYKNFMSKAMKVDPTKKSATMEGFYDSEVFLICRCLSEITDKGEKKVSPEYVKMLPQPVHEAILERAKELSGLIEEDTEEDLLEQKRDIEDRLERLRRSNQHTTNGEMNEESENTEEENEERPVTAKN